MPKALGSIPGNTHTHSTHTCGYVDIIVSPTQITRVGRKMDTELIGFQPHAEVL
jgi:hypothetical protein